MKRSEFKRAMCCGLGRCAIELSTAENIKKYAGLGRCAIELSASDRVYSVYSKQPARIGRSSRAVCKIG